MHDLTIHPDALELSDRQRDVLRRLGFDRLPAMRGADGEGGGSGGGEGGGGEGGSGGGGNGGGEGGSGGEGGGGGAGDQHTVSKAEWDNVQRQIREGREYREKAEKDKADADRKRQEDEGKFKELSESEKARADKAENDLKRERETRRVESIAKRLKFRDPEDVIGRISDEDRGDDSKVEKALKDLAKSKPYLLIDGEKDRQGGASGDGGDGSGGSGSGGGNGGSGSGSGDGGDAGIYGTSRLARAYAGSGEGKK